jgi:crossover junction endodeoxyribonuclease RusA
MPERLRFIIPGKPCTQGSKDQFGREANKRLPGWRSDARQAARDSIRGSWDLSLPYQVAFSAFYARPKNHTIGGRGLILKADAPDFPGRVGDIDKVARALLDAMTHVLWNDDDQVVDLHGRKRYAGLGMMPCLCVTVWSALELTQGFIGFEHGNN